MARSDIDQILSRITLHELISREAGVSFRRTGDRHVGLCPFHNEKTPSFVVFDGKRPTYHCFGAGCGAHGDAIDFLKGWGQMTTREAIERAARIAGLPDRGRVPERPRPGRRQAAPPPRPAKGPWSGQPIPSSVRLPRAGETVTVFDPRNSRSANDVVSMVHVYRNAVGDALLLVLRFDKDRGKYFRQVEWNAEPATGLPHVGGVWSQVRFSDDELRPLYGVEDVAQWRNMCGRSLLIVEGEKTRDAAAQLVPLRSTGMLTLANLGSFGGIGRVDWQPVVGAIKDRTSALPRVKLLLWPDADGDAVRMAKFSSLWVQSFRAAAASAGLEPNAVEFWEIAPPAGAANGWDLADALAEGWTRRDVFDWCLKNCSPIDG